MKIYRDKIREKVIICKISDITTGAKIRIVDLRLILSVILYFVGNAKATVESSDFANIERFSNLDILIQHAINFGKYAVHYEGKSENSKEFRFDSNTRNESGLENNRHLQEDLKHFLQIIYNLQYMIKTNKKDILEQGIRNIACLKLTSLACALRNNVLNKNLDFISALLNNQEHVESVLRKQSIGELFTVLAIDSILALPKEYEKMAYSSIDILNNVLGSQLTTGELNRIKEMIMICKQESKDKEDEVKKIRKWATNTIKNFVNIREHLSAIKDNVYYLRKWNIPENR